MVALVRRASRQPCGLSSRVKDAGRVRLVFSEEKKSRLSAPEVGSESCTFSRSGGGAKSGESPAAPPKRREGGRRAKRGRHDMARCDETGVRPRKEDSELYVREVTARYIGPRRKSLTITGPASAARFMRRLLRDEAREHFLALYLNGAHQVVSLSLVSLGSATHASVHAREVFQGALLVGACALIVGHNHPSGDLEPSPADVDLTKRLKEAGALLRVPLLDHVLFSATEFLSFHEAGLMA